MPHLRRPSLFALLLVGALLQSAVADIARAQSASPTLAANEEDKPAPSAPAAPVASPFGQALAERLLAQEAKATAHMREDRAALVAFFSARNNEPLWTAANGLSPAGAALYAELGRAGDWGLDANAFKIGGVPEPGAAFASSAVQAEVELAIGTAVLRYARHAHGGRTQPTSLSKYIDRQLTFVDPSRLLGEISQSAQPDAILRAQHPQHPQFELLRQKYLALKRGEKVAVAAPKVVKDEPQKGEKGDKGEKAKKKADAPRPESASVKRLLVNMEQWRWMPDDLGEYYVWVNVPEYTLRIVSGGKVVHTERAIVGKVDKQTPIFSEGMTQVIFNPSWGVPDSIKKNEILPALAKGSTRILTRNNLKLQQRGRDVDPESVDWSTADIRQFNVIQPPGGDNVLGVVKFRFPNKHDVYMHDTPTRRLFNSNDRALSHGCVRVREPEKFAQLLLGRDQSWTAQRVASAVAGNTPNNTVNLKAKIPVHMVYFTAHVEEDGKLKLFNDVYGHEPRIALGIEGKAHLIPKEKDDTGPVRVEAVGSLAEAKRDSAIAPKQDWARKAFGNY